MEQRSIGFFVVEVKTSIVDCFGWICGRNEL